MNEPTTGSVEQKPSESAPVRRPIYIHAINPLNSAIALAALDAPGSGGACHKYELLLEAQVPEPMDVAPLRRLVIEFQNGPILEAGLNGFSNEVLLAVLIDRMRGFQSGKFAGPDNAAALTKLEEALMWLQKRTRERVARGVEGTHTA